MRPWDKISDEDEGCSNEAFDCINEQQEVSGRGNGNNEDGEGMDKGPKQNCQDFIEIGW